MKCTHQLAYLHPGLVVCSSYSVVVCGTSSLQYFAMHYFSTFFSILLHYALCIILLFILISLTLTADAHRALLCLFIIFSLPASLPYWIITPNLTRSIQIDLWPRGSKSYLWQPVITSPVIQQTKMEEPQTAVSALLGLVSVAY